MRLLFGYDGSEYADAALADLHRAGLPKNVEAVILSVADIFAPPAPQGDVIELECAQRYRTRVAEAVSEANALAERAATRLRAECPQWTISSEATADSPAWAIIKHAEALDGRSRRANLIVLGAAGRSAIGRTLFGSVTSKVLNNSRCSVRISRPQTGTRTGAPIRLVLGVDGSDDSAAAIRAISERKWPSDTECQVVTVAESELLTGRAGIDSVLVSAPDNWPLQCANKAADALRKAGLTATALIREGPVARCLIQQATESNADCIFVGARGLRRLERFLLGSVPSAVAMHAPCTVEAIHS